MNSDSIAQAKESSKDNITLDINQAFLGEIAPLDMVLPGLLAGTVGSLVAPGSTGKGFFINSLIASMTAKDVLGMGIKPQNCKVTYITAEDPLAILEHRICALGTLLNPQERRTFADRVEIISLAGFQPSLLTDKNRVRFEPDGITPTTEEQWCKWLEGICQGKRLVIIDTLRRFHSAEENDSGAMTVLLQIIEGIAQRTQAAIIFTHHTKKGSTVNGFGLDADSSRGSGALIYNVRWQLNMQTMTQADADKYSVKEEHRSKYVQVFGSKVNYDEFGLQGWLQRKEGGVLVGAELRKPPETIRELKALKGGKQWQK